MQASLGTDNKSISVQLQQSIQHQRGAADEGRKEVEVKVKNEETGELHSFLLSEGATMAEVKKCIQEAEGASADQLQLFFNEREVSDSKTVGQLGLNRGPVLASADNSEEWAPDRWWLRARNTLSGGAGLGCSCSAPFQPRTAFRCCCFNCHCDLR